MSKNDRALVVLAAIDSESLQLTLQSLEHTLDRDETVVVVVNSKGTIQATKVERIARIWAEKNYKYRHVIKPLSAGEPPFDALSEAFRDFPELKNKKYICKIDDDLVPLKKGWLPALHETYVELKQRKSNMGFVTALTNNNNWGFVELLEIFEKQEEFGRIMNHDYWSGLTGKTRTPAGKADNNSSGTIMASPYTAWWLHQWTTKNIEEYISRTEHLAPKQIPGDIHYSIQCIFFEREYWLSLDWKHYATRFDEGIIHLDCRDKNLEKWAVMNQPMVHLFYAVQRKLMYELMDDFQSSFAKHFNDPAFENIERMQLIDYAIVSEEIEKEIRNYTKYVHKKFAGLSLSKKWDLKNKVRKLFHKY